MKFSAIPGLENYKKKLIQSVQTGHIAHAQLFNGVSGSLHLPLALAYAQFLQCSQHSNDSCGECPSCVKNAKYIHPDVHFYFPYLATGSKENSDIIRANALKDWRKFLLENPMGTLKDWQEVYKGEDRQPLISVETGREMLRMMQLKPYESHCKIVLVWLPEYMHMAAANAILKMVEEPPSHTYFLLVSNSIDQVLPTIQSRTQGIRIPLLTDEELRTYLQEKHNLIEKKLDEIIQLAEGNLPKSLDLIAGTESHYDYFFEWMTDCYLRNFKDLSTRALEFHKMSLQAQQNIIQYSLRMLHETVLEQSGNSALHCLQNEQLDRVVKLSKVFTLESIEFLYHQLNDALYHLHRNAAANMIFIHLSLQFSKAFVRRN